MLTKNTKYLPTKNPDGTLGEWKQTIFLKHFITKDFIEVGDYTYYDQSFGGGNLVAQLCNFQIYGNSEKKITNNPTSSDKKRGYLPRITLKRIPYPMIKGDDESFCSMIIECSLPKIT